MLRQPQLSRTAWSLLLGSAWLAVVACGDDDLGTSGQSTVSETSVESIATPVSESPGSSTSQTTGPVETDGAATTVPSSELPTDFDFGSPTSDPGLRLVFDDATAQSRAQHAAGPQGTLELVENWLTPRNNVLRVTTMPGTSPSSGFVVGTWSALWHPSIGGSDEYLELSHGNYLVHLNAPGETRQEIETAAANLRPATDRPGWTIANPDFELVSSGRNDYTIVSDVVDFDETGAIVREVRVVLDAAGSMSKPWFVVDDISLVPMGTNVGALVQGSSYSSLTWEAQPGVFIVLLARSLTTEQLIETAEELAVVDESGYNELPVVQGDGCGTVDC